MYLSVKNRYYWQIRLLMNYSLDKLVRMKRKYMEKKLSWLSKRTTICSELKSNVTKCPEIHSDGIHLHDFFKSEWYSHTGQCMYLEKESMMIYPQLQHISQQVRSYLLCSLRVDILNDSHNRGQYSVSIGIETYLTVVFVSLGCRVDDTILL